MSAVGIIGLIAVIAAWIGYVTWLNSGVKPRRLTTKLDATTVRSVFEQKVARAGRKVVDEANPMTGDSGQHPAQTLKRASDDRHRLERLGVAGHGAARGGQCSSASSCAA